MVRSWREPVAFWKAVQDGGVAATTLWRYGAERRNRPKPDERGCRWWLMRKKRNGVINGVSMALVLDLGTQKDLSQRGVCRASWRWLNLTDLPIERESDGAAGWWRSGCREQDAGTTGVRGDSAAGCLGTWPSAQGLV